MTTGMFVCEVCCRADGEFKVPADEIGQTIMAEHLSEVHNEHGPKRRLEAAQRRAMRPS